MLGSERVLWDYQPRVGAATTMPRLPGVEGGSPGVGAGGVRLDRTQDPRRQGGREVTRGGAKAPSPPPSLLHCPWTSLTKLKDTIKKNFKGLGHLSGSVG